MAMKVAEKGFKILSDNKVHTLPTESRCNFLLVYNQIPYQMKIDKIFTTLLNATFK